MNISYGNNLIAQGTVVNVDEMKQEIQEEIEKKARNGELNTYSTEETVIGKWIDGDVNRNIYRRIVNFYTVGSATWANIITIPNLRKLINFHGWIERSGANNIMIGLANMTIGYNDAGTIQYYVQQSAYYSKNAVIVLEYIKNVD